MPSTTYRFSFVVWQEEDQWVAQALETDLSFLSETREGLRYEVQRGMATQVSLAVEEGVEPFENPPPPESVRDKAQEGPYVIEMTVRGSSVEFEDHMVWKVV